MINEKIDSSISRRGFVGSTAAIAAGIAAGTALAPRLSHASDAKETESSSVSGDSENTAPIPPVEVPASWDDEADIVVVGAGGGGLNAAVHASELGMSVIVVEKLPTVGGNTQNATMFTGVNNTQQQNDAQFAIPAYPFDVTQWIDYIQGGTCHSSDPAMLKVIGENMPVVFDWMTQTYGIEWTLAGGGSFYYCQPIGMSSIVNAAYDKGTELGARFLTSTKAEALVMDGDRVVGIKAIDGDGNEIFLHGEKAVLLTAGGFAANRDLLAEYCPSALKRAAACYLANCDSGDCFRMGLGVNAAVADKNSFTMFDGGMDWIEHGGEWCRYLYDGATQIVRQPWLSVKKDGSRIRYIDSTKLGALTDQGAVETAEPDCRTRVIFDANWDSYIKGADNYSAGFAQHACREPIQEGNYRHDLVLEAYNDYHNGFQEALDAGVIVQADTIEELAEKLDMEPDVLRASVDKWNETCAAGQDDFVYPLQPQWLHPVETAPFYGAKIGGFLFMTSTGLKINTSMQVLSEDGIVIPGLYAGWYTAGGPGGSDLLTSMSYDFGGVSRSYLGGYLAAEAIASEE